MKKLALIGAVSALALFGGQTLASDLEVGVDENVVAVAGNTAVAVQDALNNNDLFSNNSSTYSSTSTFSPQYTDSSSFKIEVGDVQVNIASVDQVVPNAQMGLFTTGVPSYGVTSQGGGYGGYHEEQTCCAATVYTGNISGTQVSGTGIMGVGLNTAIANQAAVSQINIGKVQ